MLLYLAWFFISVIICYSTVNADRKTQNKAVTIYLVLLGLFVGLGDMLGGYDRYIYAELFDVMADVTAAGGNPWGSYSYDYYGSEFGYGTLCALLSYVTGNRYIFIFTLTMIIYILLIASLRRYVDNAPFAVVMFLGLWFFFTFTYLRQVIGCTVAWLSIRYIIDRDLKKFLLVLFVAYSFHNSTIVLLPAYFIPVRKFSQEKVLWVMALLLIAGLTALPNVVFSSYGTIDEERFGMADYNAEGGFRVAYLVEAAFFLYLILTNYHNIANRKKDIVMLNLALLFCAVLLFFIRSENGGRISWIFMMGVLCTVTNICVKDRRVLAHGAMLICVCLFLYFRVYYYWQKGMQLYPYKTFLTDGVRDYDPIREVFEYDHNYDKDKFYRPVFGHKE